MASLYKKPITITDPKTGLPIKSKSKKWWGRYRTADDSEKRVPLASDKTAAQAMLNELVKQVEREKAGLVDPTEKQQQRLLKLHLNDFEIYLATKGDTNDYINTTCQRISATIKASKFHRINDISASRVLEYLAELRACGKSVTSSNHYLRAIKMFTRWLVKDRRAKEDRLAHLSRMNQEVDKRRVRRPLSHEEFVRLLAAAEAGKPIQNVSGADRAVLYIVGAYTGYRRKEIASVTAHSFDFKSQPPTLTVAAGYSKHRRTDVIPLRQDFAERIQTWLKCKSTNEPLFDIADKRTAEMIAQDLETARHQWIEEAKQDPNETVRRKQSSFLSYTDEQGRYADFHALRKTFITNLTRSGTAPKTAQLLARHSDINLTMNTYTSLSVQDQAFAVEALPPLPLNKKQTPASIDKPSHISDPNAHKKVPTMVPSSAENGAHHPASHVSQTIPHCTQRRSKSSGQIAKSFEETEVDCVN